MENALSGHISNSKPVCVDNQIDLNTSRHQVDMDTDEVRFRDCLTNCMNTSTLHGIQRITGPIWKKVVWSLLIMAAIGYASWQFVSLMTEYYKYQVFVDVRFHVGTVELPQITLCHNNPYQMGKIYKHKAFQHLNESWEAWEIMDNLTEEERISLSYESSELGYSYYYDTDNQFHKLEPTFYHTLESGNCYVFNPPVMPFTILINLQTNVSNAYYDNLVPGAYVVYPFSKPAHTIHIRKPSPFDRITFQLDIINLLNGRYGNCEDDEQMFHEETGIVYTKADCEAVCRMKHTMRQCGCVDREILYSDKYKFTKTHNIRNCPQSKLHCLRDNMVNISSCGCKAKCRTTRYSIKTIQTTESFYEVDLRYNTYCRIFSPPCNPPDAKQWVLSNVARMTFSPQDQIYKEFTEKPLYPFARFISDIGGTLGICIGASVLTLFELIQSFLGIFLFLVRRYVTRH